MIEHQLIEECRPLLDDRALECGVQIKWFHPWQTETDERVTAFGYDKDGKDWTHTMVVRP